MRCWHILRQLLLLEDFLPTQTTLLVPSSQAPLLGRPHPSEALNTDHSTCPPPPLPEPPALASGTSLIGQSFDYAVTTTWVLSPGLVCLPGPADALFLSPAEPLPQILPTLSGLPWLFCPSVRFVLNAPHC